MKHGRITLLHTKVLTEELKIQVMCDVTLLLPADTASSSSHFYVDICAQKGF
jgi:hypothetical protein